jgi:threonine dehydratase
MHRHERQLDAGRVGELRAALARIESARELLAPHLRRTPTVYSHTYSESTGSDVYLKLENLQRTGSFKARGALNKALRLSDEARAKGLVAASAGNHAQGVALAAKLCGVKAAIVMPEGTALVKIQRTEGYGAEVVLHGENWDQSQARALELAAERGMTMVHPFDDQDVIDGQGTVGLEILDDLPDVECIAVAIGGGGLAAGLALAVKARSPNVRIVGVQAAGAAAMKRSFDAGERVRVERPATIAEGIKVGNVGVRTFELVRELVDEIVTVDDSEIAEAIVQTMEKSKLVVEAAGVVGLAAIGAGKIRSSGKVCAVICGGNIDLNLLARLIEAGMANSGRYHLVELRLGDAPGQLHRVLGLIAEAKGNVLDVQHYRAGWRVPVGFVDVEILVETRNLAHGHEIDSRLRAEGFEVRAGSHAAG